MIFRLGQLIDHATVHGRVRAVGVDPTISLRPKDLFITPSEQRYNPDEPVAVYLVVSITPVMVRGGEAFAMRVRPPLFPYDQVPGMDETGEFSYEMDEVMFRVLEVDDPRLAVILPA